MSELNKRLAARRWFSSVVLRLVAQLPEFQSGWVRQLQDVRKEQERDRDELRQELKSSEKPTVFLSHLYVTELYFVEDLDRLKKQLLKLFPEDPYGFTRTAVPVQSEAQLRASGWQVIGTLSHKAQGQAMRNVVLQDLPTDISHIYIESHHLMSSAWVLSFVIVLNQKVSDFYAAILSTPPLGQVTFASWAPFRRRGWMNSSTPSEHDARIRVSQFEADIQKVASDFLKRHFSGFFFSQSSTFPVVLGIKLSGSPAKEIGDTERRRSAWKRVLDLEQVYWAGFKTDEAHILLRSESHPPRLLNFSESSEDQVAEYVGYEAGKALAIELITLDFVSVIESWLATRRKAFFSIWRLRSNSRSLLTVLKLNRRGSAYNFAVKRMLIEASEYFARFSRWESVLRGFVLVRTETDNLRQIIEENSLKRLDDAESYLDLMLNVGREEISIQNARLMFTLQRRMYWLTLGTLILATYSISNGMNHAWIGNQFVFFLRCFHSWCKRVHELNK